MKCHYREKKYICGNYIDLQVYPVYPVKKCRNRKNKYKPTSETQQKLNDENANKKLSRYINANFTNEDYMLTLTYADKYAPEDEQRAKKDIQNFLRRIKRQYSKKGIELKYIWVMEKSERTGRIHFHTVITGGIDRTELENVWGFGFANTRALKFTENGVEGLVKYYTKDKLLYRRFNASKNLIRPIERQNDNKVSNKKARDLYEVVEEPEFFKRVYPGYYNAYSEYEIASVKAQLSELNGQLYFSIRLFNRKAVYGEERHDKRLRDRSIQSLCSSGETDSGRAKGKTSE